MPLFLIERNFAEQLEVSRDDVLQVTQVNADVGTVDRDLLHLFGGDEIAARIGVDDILEAGQYFGFG